MTDTQNEIAIDIPTERGEHPLPPGTAEALGIMPTIVRQPGRGANALDDRVIVRWCTRSQPKLIFNGIVNRISHQDGATVLEVPPRAADL